jgi:transcription elongation factor Elf1
MGNQADNSSPTPKPKWEIPDSWAANGRCPACGAQRLKSVHLPNYPDYLNCASCELSFEVEDGGRHIHVKYLSDKYESTDKSLYNHWVDVSALNTIVKKIPPTTTNETFIAAPTQSFTDKEVWDRALRMYKLGEKPQAVQLTLKKAGATQRQAEVILSRLTKMAEEDIKKQSDKFLTVTGISIFLVILATGSWLVFSGRLPVLLGLVTPTPVEVVEEPSTINQLLNIIPDNVQPSLLDLPETVADTRRGPGPSACPESALEAAGLFGGTSALWTYDSQFIAWQMLSANASYTIQVPMGMVAGYVDNKSFQLVSIHGPATIYNANFVTIMCE